MTNSDIYNTLKNMTLEEFISIFVFQPKENNVPEIIEMTNQDNNKTLYTINDLIEKYPFFTRYNIKKAIEDEGLPYCTLGNKKLFNKEEVEKWIDKETKPKKEKIKYDI